MDFDECRSNLYPFKDIKPPVDPILTYEEDASDATLVIDNGEFYKSYFVILSNDSYHCWFEC